MDDIFIKGNLSTEARGILIEILRKNRVAISAMLNERIKIFNPRNAEEAERLVELAGFVDLTTKNKEKLLSLASQYGLDVAGH